MKKAILMIFSLSIIGCGVHRIPVINQTDFDRKTTFSIGIVNCNKLEIDQSERRFTPDQFDVDFVQILQDSKLFKRVKCVEANDTDVDFMIEAKQQLKITEGYSCGLDNTFFVTIGTLGLISTGCTTYYNTSLVATNVKSRKQFTIDYQHNGDRRNGIPGFLSEFSRAWDKDDEPFPLDSYYKVVALEIYKMMTLADR